MVHLQRVINWSLLVVLCSTVPCFCVDNSSALNSNTSVDQPKVPTVFPQNGTNETKIVSCENFQNTLNTSNSSNPNLAKLVCTNITVDVPNSLNTTNTTDEHLQVKDDNSTTTLKYTEEDSTTAGVETTSLSAIETGNNTIANISKLDGEVDDLMNETSYSNPNHLPPASVSTVNNSEGINLDTELIDDGQNTEDNYRNSSAFEDDTSAAGVPLIQGQLAAILAGVFVAISVIAYVGLLSWRRYLENRYGSRQMLVNEDEFNDDMKHFSI